MPKTRTDAAHETVSYAAFLGNHPNLSLAELRSAVPDLTVQRMMGNGIAIVRTARTLTNEDLEGWGGIFLLARQIPGNHDIAGVPDIVRDEVARVKGKVTFSLRAYGVDRRAVHGLYRDCKKYLKKLGVPCRYIGNEHKPPVSAQLHDEGLISGKHGREIVLLADHENDFFWVGMTIAAQNPDAYTRRDMEKPVRDTRAGLLPPKLAQIMLNLGAWMAREEDASIGKELTVLDPFCGTGVIPMEALIKRWNVLASDASQKAVNGCEKNMDWIRKEYAILKRDVTADARKHDARKPFDFKVRPDVIVTETMLGPALDGRPTVKDVQKYRTECDALEIAFLENVAASLPGVPVVCMFPVWYVKTGPVFLEKVWNKLPHIGFVPVLPPGAPADNPERNSLLYRRTDQFVGREILLLKPAGEKMQKTEKTQATKQKARA